MQADPEEDWSCSICFRLVLDPIVSACGHDFCREVRARACASASALCMHPWPS